MIKLSIIIVSYNTAHLTWQTVQSIYDNIAPTSFLASAFEIIVVDNHSHDHTLVLLKKFKKKNLLLLPQKDNLGFGKANNIGFQSARGEYLLFLNSDTIVQPQSLEKLVTYYQQQEKAQPPLGLLASKLLNQDGSLQPQGGDHPTLLSLTTTMLFWDDLPFLGKILPAVQHTGHHAHTSKTFHFEAKGWVGGTAVLVKKALLLQYGAWDENIFMYGEDQELAYRLSLQGYQHGICHQASIIHLGSASSSSSRALIGEIKGYFYFWHKFYPPWQKHLLKIILLLSSWLRWLIFSLISKNQTKAQAYREALDFIKSQ